MLAKFLAKYVNILFVPPTYHSESTTKVSSALTSLSLKMLQTTMYLLFLLKIVEGKYLTKVPWSMLLWTKTVFQVYIPYCYFFEMSAIKGTGNLSC